MSVRPGRRPSIDAQRIAAGLDSQIADGDWSEDRDHKQQREAAVRIQAQRRGQCARRHAHKKPAPRPVPPPVAEETGYHMSALSDAEVAREREQREERERQRRAEQQQAALRVQSAVRGKV